jgi:lipid-binding SYLF domain-containing protein
MHTAIRIYAIIAFLLVPGAAFAQQDSQQKQGVPEAELAAQLLDRAEATFATFNAKPKFQNVINRARAVLIIPKLTRAGILVGIKGGSGVLFAQDMNTGEWSAPAFYRAFSASVGVQIGVEEAQAAFVIMSERALEGVLAGDFQFGSDASVTIGSGDNVASKSDVYSFTLVEGLFGGISLEGVEVTANRFRNRAFYGERLTARDIVTDPAVTNPAADKVRVAMRGERYKAAQARKEADRLALERAQTLANKSAEIGVRKTDQGIAFVM